MYNKLQLDDVTLICVETRKIEVAKNLCSNLNDKINFNQSLLITSGINTIQDYNKLIHLRLNSLFNTEFCMIVQLDGYPINIDFWKWEFLDYDFIGAPWYTQPVGITNLVGNGGFSIRSKRYVEQCMKTHYMDYSRPEDVFYNRDNKLNVKYAPHGLAYEFSVEDLPYNGQFGFHGKGTIQLNTRMGIFNASHI